MKYHGPERRKKKRSKLITAKDHLKLMKRNVEAALDRFFRQRTAHQKGFCDDGE